MTVSTWAISKKNSLQGRDPWCISDGEADRGRVSSRCDGGVGEADQEDVTEGSLGSWA